MATVLKLGPADHGQLTTEEDLRFSDFEEGYKYEIIDGRLYVSYEPDLPECVLDGWLLTKVKDYSRRRPQVINFVSNKTRLFVPGRPGLTGPETRSRRLLRFSAAQAAQGHSLAQCLSNPGGRNPFQE